MISTRFVLRYVNFITYVSLKLKKKFQYHGLFHSGKSGYHFLYFMENNCVNVTSQQINERNQNKHVIYIDLIQLLLDTGNLGNKKRETEDALVNETSEVALLLIHLDPMLSTT